MACPTTRMTGGADPARWLNDYGDLLFRYALVRVGNETLAEDLVQETLLAAWRGREGFSGHSSESTWLVGILKHKIADHFRKAPLVSLDELDIDPDCWFDEQGHWRRPPDSWGDPQHNLDMAQLRQILIDCIAQLPPRFRHLFYLREVEGLSAKEICKQLPLSSTNNVWVMLSRMRLRLRQCLERAGFDGQQEKTS